MSMMGSRVTALPSQVRLFLRARSPEDLVRKQLELNIAVKGRIDLTDIQFVDGQWYGWFMIDVDQHAEVVKELLNGAT